MKLSIGCLFLVIGLSSSVLAGERYIVRDLSPWEVSLHSYSFEEVNMVPLFEKARERYPEVSSHELTPRVKMNINYIFHNRLNRGRFLVAPSPESIIEQIHLIFELSEELDRLVDRGRALVTLEKKCEDYKEVIRKIGKTADELRKSFENFFIEGGGSHYVLEYPTVEPLSAQFTHFILQSERINRDLGKRLSEFFFGPSPGAINLADYEKSSIHVLSESLSKLSRVAEPRFDGSIHSR